MNFQSLIVALVIVAALAYIGRNAWRKTKSFSSGKSGCESDCGCSTSSSVKQKM